MELTSTQSRALKKALTLMLQFDVSGRMTKDEKCLFNEIISDWADIPFKEINYEHHEGIVTSATGLIQPGENVRLV